MSKLYLFNYKNYLKYYIIAMVYWCLPTQGFTNDQATDKKTSNSSKKDFYRNVIKGKIIRPIDSQDQKSTALEKKVLREAKSDDNPRSITSHKLNYFVPFSYNNSPNRSFRNDVQGLYNIGEARHLEALYQLSFKAKAMDFFSDYGGALYFSFTSKAFWQVYDRDNSSPFRETNYEPEIFVTFPFEFKVLNQNISLLTLGLSHESNGSSVPRSRSWNRIYAQFQIESGDWIYSLKPWYRIPEKEKTDPLEVKGDDNPDIERFLGHFEAAATLQNHRHEMTFTLRNNLRSDNKGSLQVDWTFPIKSSFKPYVQIFTGYGDSLIDYNHFTRRISFGFLLTGWL